MNRKLPSALSAAGKNKKYDNKQTQPSRSEQQGKHDRFDAVTRKFMFTIQNLSKTLPGDSKQVLKNINLCFYPGTSSIQ